MYVKMNKIKNCFKQNNNVFSLFPFARRSRESGVYIMLFLPLLSAQRWSGEQSITFLAVPHYYLLLPRTCRKAVNAWNLGSMDLSSILT